MENLLSPGFWDQEWERFRQRNAIAGQKKKPAHEYWNMRAENFARATIESSSNRERVAQVFSFLNYFDILRPGISILDIGSGPGSFSIPFAEMGFDVVALDPAEKMLELLQRNIPAGLPGKIETVNALWEDFDVTREGLEGKFDLVFASMCPGIHTLQSIEKMLLCSRNWCYISAFSGSRKYPLHDQIFNRLFNENYRNWFNDIIFPFNLVYSLGYQPAIRFLNTKSKVSQPALVFKDEIMEIINGRSPITPEIESIIDRVIAEHSDNGLLEQQVLSVVGMMTWNKTQAGR